MCARVGVLKRTREVTTVTMRASARACHSVCWHPFGCVYSSIPVRVYFCVLKGPDAREVSNLTVKRTSPLRPQRPGDNVTRTPLTPGVDRWPTDHATVTAAGSYQSTKWQLWQQRSSRKRRRAPPPSAPARSPGTAGYNRRPLRTYPRRPATAPGKVKVKYPRGTG
jgi:hypothetical protein